MQTELFQDSASWRSSLIADIDAAGGPKLVATQLWPELDPETALRKLSNALNAKQKQQFGYTEIQQVKRLARIRCGKSQLHAFESKELACNVHWQTAEDIATFATASFASLTEQARIFQEELARTAALVARMDPRK